MTAAGSDVSDDASDNYGWDQALDADVEALLNATTTTTTTATPAATATTATATAAVQDVHLLVQPEGVVDSLSTEDTLSALVRHVDYPDLSQLLSDVSEPAGNSQPPAGTLSVDAPSDPSSASPLARFRTAPRKPFSVSDLTAGAWCELQYEYTLTRLPGGRRTRTAAMKAGTRVHARLEEQVHTTVRVQVATREDGFGLRLWNLIQGLRTLRETGLTRELEIWGLVGGDDKDGEPQVVNGIIDALSYENPDPSYGQQSEAAAEPVSPTPKRRRGRPSKKDKEKEKEKEQTPQSSRITDFFPSPTAPSLSSSPPIPTAPPKIYITDVKTRGSTRLPSGAAMRPTEMQLFLYHRLLSDLASGGLDFYRILARYRLDPDAPFSDAYVAQIGGLYDEIFADDVDGEVVVLNTETAADDSSTLSISPSTNIRYRSLRLLLSLVQDEIRLTFPHGADSIGGLVSVEYRLRPGMQPKKRQRMREQTPESTAVKPEEDTDSSLSSDASGDSPSLCIGTKVLVVDRARLDAYLDNYLAWWRGERPATGVTELEEAYLKCGYCEFAADCSWRQALDDARVQHVRASMQEKATRG